MSEFVRFSTVTLVAGLLAGCGSSVPEVTDEEIISLLGENRGVFSRDDDAPLTIAKMTVECAEALSGANAEVLKDMPAELLGMMKTDCRQKFDRIIKDSARNSKGFKLEHFENKDFAKRIETAAEKSHEIYKAYEVKRKEEEKAQRWKEKEEKLTEARVKFEQSLEGYEAVVDEVVALCTEVNEVRAVIQREQGREYWVEQDILNICSVSREDFLGAIGEDRAKWAAVEVVEGSFGPTYTEPSLTNYQVGTITLQYYMMGKTENLELTREKVQSHLAKAKQRLEQ